MPRTFDPYHTWLGIPPDKQPPNHYDLLGIPLFEDKPEVIEAAADRQMGHLRTYQAAKHSQFSQQLLNEVATARVCLLNAEKKAGYDQRIREQLRAARRPPAKGLQPQPTGMTPTTEFNQLGEYQLLEKLGQGGMGAVYKALHTKLGREVALKVLSPGKLGDQKAIARFEREMRAVGQLDHANVVRAMDAREVSGTHFLVMEFVDGLNLSEVVDRMGPLSIVDSCEVIRQAALGLQAAHQKQLVHRDIKPSNLMLDPQGRVKVLDMGLALFKGETPGGEVTAASQALGTLDYMAPEQTTDTHAVDIRADIYSLGCTFYKLLSGRAPFADSAYATPFEKMEAHLRKPPRSIRQFRDDVPKELMAVLNRMLSKRPERRYQAPAEVADAVGPLAATADLSKLLAQARRTPPMRQPDRSLAETREPKTSSALTRFFQRVTPGAVRPAARTAAGKKPHAALLPVLGGLGIAAVLLVGVVVWGLLAGDDSPPTLAEGTTAMVFDWPESQRNGAAVFIDDQPRGVPDSGPFAVDCLPGKYRIRAVRKGFLPYAERIEVQAGTRHKITPTWVAQSHLILKWPTAERTGAKLELDGKTADPSAPGNENTAEHIKLALEPGPHTVWIGRRGFELFEQTVTVVEGEDLTVTPEWKQLAGITPPATEEPIVGSPPTQGKLPFPAEEARQAVGVQIAEFYKIADAKTEADKAALAGQLLEAGKGPKDNPAERYVLLERAMQLATEGGDASLVQETIDALAEHFEVDAEKLTQTALARIDEIHRQQREAQAAKQEAARIAAQEKARRQRWSEATATAEQQVAAWDFTRALAALEPVRFDDDPELTARLTRRRDEVQRMAGLKAKMISKINARPGQFKKSDLMLRGVNGEIQGADHTAITAKLASGKTETHAWPELNQKAQQRLLQLAVNRQNADDWVSAGVMAFGLGDTELAEKLLAQAHKQGAEVGPYLAPLAEAIYTQATELLDQRQFDKASAALNALTINYGKTPWFVAHKDAVAATRAAIRSGIYEAEAERLYAEAARLFKDNRLFELKPIVEKLWADYATSRAVTDTQHKRSIAEMLKVVTNLGKFITVGTDAKGDFKSIQQAVLAAPPNSVIEICDSGVYVEEVRVPSEKERLTIRGKKGCRPIIRSPRPVLTVEAPGLSIERLVLVHDSRSSWDHMAVDVRHGPVRMRSTLVCAYENLAAIWLRNDGTAELESCVYTGAARVGQMAVAASNCVWLREGIQSEGSRVQISFHNTVARRIDVRSPCTLRQCTIEEVRLEAAPNLLVDSIFGQVESSNADTRIDHCDVFGEGYKVLAKPGKGCFKADPQFRDPRNFDYRLMANSPCRGKASDGEDLGCRYTPEMLEMLKLALELRVQGIIKF